MGQNVEFINLTQKIWQTNTCAASSAPEKGTPAWRQNASGWRNG